MEESIKRERQSPETTKTPPNVFRKPKANTLKVIKAWPPSGRKKSETFTRLQSPIPSTSHTDGPSGKVSRQRLSSKGEAKNRELMQTGRPSGSGQDPSQVVFAAKRRSRSLESSSVKVDSSQKVSRQRVSPKGEGKRRKLMQSRAESESLEETEQNLREIDVVGKRPRAAVEQAVSSKGQRKPKRKPHPVWNIPHKIQKVEQGRLVTFL